MLNVKNVKNVQLILPSIAWTADPPVSKKVRL